MCSSRLLVLSDRSVSSVVIGLVLGIGFFGIIKLILWVVLVDCVLVGLFVSTIYWYVCHGVETCSFASLLGMSPIGI